jgi:putative tryptophan/tyrosine transport system substrate-binding protein
MIAWPLAALAQPQAAASTIGFLTIGLTSQMLFVDGFRRGLKEAGFVEGQNVNIEYRSAENDYDRLLSLVDDLIRQQVALIFANSSTPAALAAKARDHRDTHRFHSGCGPGQIGPCCQPREAGRQYHRCDLPN